MTRSYSTVENQGETVSLGAFFERNIGMSATTMARTQEQQECLPFHPRGSFSPAGEMAVGNGDVAWEWRLNELCLAVLPSRARTPAARSPLTPHTKTRQRAAASHGPATKQFAVANFWSVPMTSWFFPEPRPPRRAPDDDSSEISRLAIPLRQKDTYRRELAQDGVHPGAFAGESEELQVQGRRQVSERRISV